MAPGASQADAVAAVASCWISSTSTKHGRCIWLRGWGWIPLSRARMGADLSQQVEPDQGVGADVGTQAAGER